MDLLKAFDCLPHKLLLFKLKTSGISENALKLMTSYLTNRKQCVKLGNFKSYFQTILKGMSQGSILGPVLFNIFIYDIFHFIKNYSCIIMQMTMQYHMLTQISRDSLRILLKTVRGLYSDLQIIR